MLAQLGSLSFIWKGRRAYLVSTRHSDFCRFLQVDVCEMTSRQWFGESWQDSMLRQAWVGFDIVGESSS